MLVITGLLANRQVQVASIGSLPEIKFRIQFCGRVKVDSFIGLSLLWLSKELNCLHLKMVKHAYLLCASIVTYLQSSLQLL